ncbi:transmembrane protein [Thraustotheca clavata]|uniref:Transmembrane protein n=1 Tax=Thraustotheca clavata TaxID=74557 RepID=A0A1W0A1A2_9STRA|nr:transmembrane protein [Thraustotheca clavata]
MHAPLQLQEDAVVDPLPYEENDAKALVKYKETSSSGAALRDGGAVDVYARDNIGLLINYASVGFVHGTFPSTIYPFLNMYLNMDGFQIAAASALVALPWSFKMTIGIISDSFPINGYRRKPYILLGWMLCFVFLMAMAILPIQNPYYSPGEIQRTSNSTDRLVLNAHAPDQGNKYIVLMMFASLGYVIADVACDAIVVECAQREEESIRGRTQTTIYTVRYAFQTIASAIVGLGFNGQAYGGSFNWSLSFPNMMALTSIATLCGVTGTLLAFPKEIPAPRVPFRTRLLQMWHLAQSRVIWQLMAFSFFNAFLFDFEAIPSIIVQRDWARVQPLNAAIFTVISLALMTLSLHFTKHHLMQMNWRVLIFITTIAVVALDSTVSFLTIFDIVRNQWFYLGAPVLGNIPQGVRFVVSTYASVEVAEVGFEGTTYGLLTTVSNLAGPFSSSVSKFVDSFFDAYQQDIAKDTLQVRMQVAYTFIIMYTIRLASNFTLILLPRQKKHAQYLRQHGGQSRLAAVIAFSLYVFCLTWSIATNILSIIPSTACWRIAGGDGCGT